MREKWSKEIGYQTRSYLSSLEIVMDFPENAIKLNENKNNIEKRIAITLTTLTNERLQYKQLTNCLSMGISSKLIPDPLRFRFVLPSAWLKSSWPTYRKKEKKSKNHSLYHLLRTKIKIKKINSSNYYFANTIPNKLRRQIRIQFLRK